MIKHGPVDVIVLAFSEARFDGSALAELRRQAATGTIRVLDIMIVRKDDDGGCWYIQMSDLPSEQAAAVDFIEAGTIGLLDEEDAFILGEGMVPGSALAVLAIENTWAINLVNAIHEEGGELAISHRVPAPVVEEAFAALS